jgi:hypothetical protein
MIIIVIVVTLMTNHSKQHRKNTSKIYSSPLLSTILLIVVSIVVAFMINQKNNNIITTQVKFIHSTAGVSENFPSHQLVPPERLFPTRPYHVNQPTASARGQIQLSAPSQDHIFVHFWFDTCRTLLCVRLCVCLGRVWAVKSHDYEGSARCTPGGIIKVRVCS